jgi:hypothetical protein
VSTTQEYTPKAGDRVRITFDVEITHCFGGRYVVVAEPSLGFKDFWGGGDIEAANVVSVEAL